MKNISLKTISGSALMRRTALIFVALAFVATVAASEAQAAEFYAIIANLNDANNPHAQIDVAVDTQALPGGAPSTVLFNVYRADGTQLAEFEVLTNSHGFASSAFAPAPYDNLFTVSEGLPALVRVRTVTSSSLASAVLRQTLKPSNIPIAVPPVRRSDGSRVAMGSLFSTPIGNIIAPGATLLIANLSGGDIAVDIFLGAKGAPGAGKYVNPRMKSNAFWIVDLDPADSNSHFLVSSTGDVIVQLAVGDGKKGISAVQLLPL